MDSVKKLYAQHVWLEKLVRDLQIFPFIDGIFIFGSRTQPKHAKFADVDLAISCPHANVYEWQKILDIIDNANTLLRIDCVRYDEIVDKKFKDEIDKTKEVLYEKK